MDPIKLKEDIPIIKIRIPILCLIGSIFSVISSIDTGLAFDLINVLIYHELEEHVTVIVSTIFILIISSHFEAHYKILRVPYPSNFRYLFFSNAIILYILLCIVTDLGAYFTRRSIFQCVGRIAGIFFIFYFITVDLYGYFLIRRVLLENSVYRKSYTSRLNRMTKFHCIMNAIFFIFLIILLQNIIQWFRNGYAYGRIPDTVDPNKYTIDTNVILHSFCIFTFGWWSFPDSLNWNQKNINDEDNDSQMAIQRIDVSLPSSAPGRSELSPSHCDLSPSHSSGPHVEEKEISPSTPSNRVVIEEERETE